MGYKLSFNTPNGGKGTLGLMKNYAFNSSMCDGLCIKYRVPSKVIETKLSFYYQYTKNVNGDVFGDKPLKIELSVPVDEYITVMIKGYYMQEVGGVLGGQYIKHEVSDTAIILPSQKTSYTSNVFSDGYTLSMLLIYVGKRAVYYSENETELAEFRDNYFRIFEKPINSLEGIKEEDIVGYPLKSLAESLYVFPLVKTKPVITGLTAYLPTFRYKGEIYYPVVKITDLKKDNFISQLEDYVPDEVLDDIKNSNDNTESEDFEAFWGYMWSEVKNGGLFVGDVRYEQITVSDSEGGDWVASMLPYIFSEGDGAVGSSGNMIIGFDSSQYPDGRIIQMPLRKDGKLVGYILVAEDGHGNILAAESIEMVDGDFVQKQGDAVNVKVTKNGEIIAISSSGDLSILTSDGERLNYEYKGTITDSTGNKYDVYDDGSGVETQVEEGFWDEGPESPSGGDGEGGE